MRLMNVPCHSTASLFLAYAYVDSALYWFMLLLLLRRFSRVGLCDPRDGSPLGFSIPGILQARILEWVAISFSNACMHTKLLQSCPTLSDPMDCSPPGSSIHGIFQTRVPEWGATTFSVIIHGYL